MLCLKCNYYNILNIKAFVHIDENNLYTVHVRYLSPTYKSRRSLESGQFHHNFHYKRKRVFSCPFRVLYDYSFFELFADFVPVPFVCLIGTLCP